MCVCARACTHHGVLSLLYNFLHFVSSFEVFISIVTAPISRGLERDEREKKKKRNRWSFEFKLQDEKQVITHTHRKNSLVHKVNSLIIILSDYLMLC